MNTNERNEFVKLDEPNILPDTAQNEVKGTDDKQTVEEKETIVEGSQDMDVALENIDIVSDDEENEDVETEYDFSTLNKLELVEILEETVQDTDVVKIKDKVAAIKFNFLRLSKEDREREMEQFILDGGEKENYEHVEDPLEIRFKSAFNIFKENNRTVTRYIQSALTVRERHKSQPKRPRKATPSSLHLQEMKL